MRPAERRLDAVTSSPFPVPPNGRFDEDPTRTRDTLLAAHEALPKDEDVRALHAALQPELERGYLSPESDERLRSQFANYLHVRSALVTLLQSARRTVPIYRRHLKQEELKLFLGGWLAGCMLMRTSRYLMTHFQHQELVRSFLNQAHPYYGIPPRMFDTIRDNSTHPRNLFRFFWALQIAESHQEQLNRFQEDPDCAPLLALLQEEQPFLETQKRTHADAFARAQVARARQRPGRHFRAFTWELFERSGRLISKCRNPFHRKRVKRPTVRKLEDLLKPGDIIVTRHDDALSNLFLPGFWPHAALCIGSPEQRKELNASFPDDLERKAGPSISFLEAQIDGVRIRPLTYTLAVDTFALLRPTGLKGSELAEILQRAAKHEGKLYDFEFDFNRSDRMVCTEVIYRSMDGVGPVHFNCIKKAGRFTLPTEELIRQALQQPHFSVHSIYGLTGTHWVKGEQAGELLKQSLETL